MPDRSAAPDTATRPPPDCPLDRPGHAWLVEDLEPDAPPDLPNSPVPASPHLMPDLPAPLDAPRPRPGLAAPEWLAAPPLLGHAPSGPPDDGPFLTVARDWRAAALPALRHWLAAGHRLRVVAYSDELRAAVLAAFPDALDLAGRSAQSLGARAEAVAASRRAAVAARAAPLEENRAALETARRALAAWEARPGHDRPGALEAQRDQLDAEREHFAHHLDRESGTPFGQLRRDLVGRHAHALEAARAECGELLDRVNGLDNDLAEVGGVAAQLRGELGAKRGLLVSVRGLLRADDRPARLAVLETSLVAKRAERDQVAARHAEAEARAAELAAAAEAELGELDRAELERRRALLDGQLAELDAKLQSARDAERAGRDACRAAGLPELADLALVAARLERAEAELAGCHAELAACRPERYAPHLLAGAALVVAGPEPAAPDEARFDRVVMLGAESATEADLVAAWGHAPAQWLVASHRGNGPVSRLVTRQRPRWQYANGWRVYLDARLVPTRAEPLASCPEVVIHWAKLPDKSEEPAMLAFPPHFDWPRAAAVVRDELDSHELVAPGEPAWRELPEAVAAEWGGEPAGECGLAPGLSECRGRCGPHEVPPLVRLRFDASAGWTPESARDWLAANRLPTLRVVVLS